MRVFKQLFLILLCVCLIITAYPQRVYAVEDTDTDWTDDEYDAYEYSDESDDEFDDEISPNDGLPDELPDTDPADLQSLLGTPPEITSVTGVMIDADTGLVLYDKQMNDRMYPASMTKVISAIVALNHASLTDEVTFSDNAINSLDWDAMTIGVSVGDTLTLKDALIGMLLPSANECANGVAEFIGGSMDGFADMMNDWALSVGAVNSHFITPSGLFEYEHYTTAYDMAIMMRAALANPAFLELEALTEYTISATDFAGETREIPVTARHQMAGTTGFIAGKTGYEDLAGNTLVTAVERDGTTLITVVMDSEDYYADTMALMDYGFSTFEHSTAAKAVPALFSAQSGDGFYSIFDSDYYPIAVDPHASLVTVKGMDSSRIMTEASYQTGNAPITADDAVGYVTFTYDSFILGYAPIVRREVPAAVVPEPGTPANEEALTNENTGNDIISVIRGLPTVLKVFCVILLIVLVLLLVCVLAYLVLLLRAQYIRYQREKRRKERLARQKRARRREQLDSKRILHDDGSDELDF